VNAALLSKECPMCKAWGFIDIELPANEGNHTTEKCENCLGTGYVHKWTIARVRTASRLRKLKAVRIAEKAMSLFAFRMAMDYREKLLEAVGAAEKYRDVYCEVAAPKYGHHVESMKKAERLPWEILSKKEDVL